MTHSHWSSTEPQPEHTIDNLETLKIYFDPMRIKIVHALAKQARTVHEIADELNIPFTRLYYHLNLLEKHGIIRVVETRALAGAVEENYYRVTAHMFVIDRKLMTIRPDDSESGLELLLDTVLENTRRDIRESINDGVIDLEKRAPEPDALLIRRGFSYLTEDQARHFSERILALMQEITLAQNQHEGQYYAMVMAFYPSSLPDKTSDDDVPPGATPGE